MDTNEESSRMFHFQDILIESSIDGILACNEEREIIVFNKRMERVLGYTKMEVVGKMSLQEFFFHKEGEKFEERLYSEEPDGKDKVFLYETVLISKDGAKVPVNLSASVLFQEGKEIGVVCFVRDLRDIRELTQRYADQAELLHHDKMISLGELAASVVHEINNPIAGILNYNRLMLKILGRGSLTQESQKKFQDYLTLMEGQLSRCSEIVIDLLAFSRKSKQEFSEVDVNEVVEKCIALSDHRLTLQNIRIQLHLQPEMPKVFANFNQLQQSLLNLIFNAMDAMQNGGALTIRTSLDPGKTLVLVQVEDNGCGISKENLGLIFDAFFTTKGEGKGIGIGLYTVKSIMERHKGTINVESEVGKGTVFTIELPVGGRRIEIEPVRTVKDMNAQKNSHKM